MSDLVGIRLKLTLGGQVILFNATPRNGKDQWVEIGREQAVALIERHLFGLRYDRYLLEGVSTAQ